MSGGISLLNLLIEFLGVSIVEEIVSCLVCDTNIIY